MVNRLSLFIQYSLYKRVKAHSHINTVASRQCQNKLETTPSLVYSRLSVKRLQAKLCLITELRSKKPPVCAPSATIQPCVDCTSVRLSHQTSLWRSLDAGYLSTSAIADCYRFTLYSQTTTHSPRFHTCASCKNTAGTCTEN